MTAYYNEIDPKAAAGLRALIEDGLIPSGEVDERSIVDVRAKDLSGFTQCHFFAGIGGWAHALSIAEWPDERSIWTGSCPCQPYSSAGKHKGGGDSRDLWPVWFALMLDCIAIGIEIPIIAGEQVANAISHGWLDRVFFNLGGEGYTGGAAVLPASGVNAPHLRNRLYWMAYASGSKWRSEAKERNVSDGEDAGRQETSGGHKLCGQFDYMANAGIISSGAGLCETEAFKNRNGVARNSARGIHGYPPPSIFVGSRQTPEITRTALG